jgi:GNAT superfamily N-acetyltransferase
MSSRSNAPSARSSRIVRKPSSHGPCSVSAAEEREHQAGGELLAGGDRRGQRLAAIGGRVGRQPGQLAPHQLEVEVAGAQAIDERAGGAGLEPIERARAEVAAAIEAGAVGVEQEHRGVGDPARLLERGDHAIDQVGHRDDGGQLAAQRLEAPAHLVALAQEPAVDAVLEPAAHRLEQDQDHERRDQRVSGGRCPAGRRRPTTGAASRPPTAAPPASRARPSCRPAR